MAEGFEPYHVPQQSRRDKLRVLAQTQTNCVENLRTCTNLVPFYDLSLIPSDWITSTTSNLQHQNNTFTSEPIKSTPNPTQTSCCVKPEGSVNLMGYNNYIGGLITASSTSSSTTNELFMNVPQSSIQLNPNSIQDMNTNPFLYTSQDLRVFDHQACPVGGEVTIYKPAPLSVANEYNRTTTQGLSLSLSSDKYTPQSNLELNLQRYDSSMFATLVGGSGGGGSVSMSNDLTRSSVPLGPFTGYASILKGSRFLKPAQQLLEEFCDVNRGSYTEKMTVDSGLIDPPLERLSGSSGILDDLHDGGEQRGKKSTLISMLDEVYKRYKQYYQQMQAVVASFEAVAGLSNAAPFANFALKSMSKHFKTLKNAITEQLHFTTKPHADMNYGKDETPRLGNPDRLYGQRTIQNSGFMDNQPVWRPQRGLPDRAVTVLRAWLFEHFLHPYPTDTDKLMLAKQTGLSRNQVSNWFINARVRLWKPMVEEIHTLETRQAQKALQREEQNAERQNDRLPPSNTSLPSDNPSTSMQRIQDFPTTRVSSRFPDGTVGNGEPMNVGYTNLSHHGVGVGRSGISLTLGLHQENGVRLSEPFPLNAARRFGLDANSEAYVMGGFEPQNRQFGRDLVGGQLFHDFVG